MQPRPRFESNFIMLGAATGLSSTFPASRRASWTRADAAFKYTARTWPTCGHVCEQAEAFACHRMLFSHSRQSAPRWPNRLLRSTFDHCRGEACGVMAPKLPNRIQERAYPKMDKK